MSSAQTETLSRSAPPISELLASHLQGRTNNLDLLRLIAAALVIVGHSYAVVGSGQDPMARWNGHVYSGAFSLHVFFFISGMLVTNSFQRKPDIVSWLFSRGLRILPALAVCLALTTFLLGPLLTTLPLGQYMTDRGTWDYFFGNLFLLRTRYLLPGVFTTNPDHAINGPLWSLYLEVRLYLCAAILLVIFKGRPRIWLTAALGAIAAATLVSPGWLAIFGPSKENGACSLLFVMGAICAHWSDKVLISNLWIAVVFVACCYYVWTPVFPPVFLLFTGYFVLCFGFSKLLTAIHLPGDYSYGLYIYGWPVQQLMVMAFPHATPLINMLCSLMVATGIAALSWRFIEKPSLARKTIIRAARTERWKLAPAMACACCALVLTISASSWQLPAAVSFKAAAPAPANRALNMIQSFGPDKIVAGKPFNVQADGRSAMWVQLAAAANNRASIVFRGRKLATVVSGKLLTASVPSDLISEPGDADIYVLDESASPPKRTASARMTVSRAN